MAALRVEFASVEDSDELSTGHEHMTHQRIKVGQIRTANITHIVALLSTKRTIGVNSCRQLWMNSFDIASGKHIWTSNRITFLNASFANNNIS